MSLAEPELYDTVPKRADVRQRWTEQGLDLLYMYDGVWQAKQSEGLSFLIERTEILKGSIISLG